MLLWIDGKPEDADVVALAQDRLGPRCRISYLRSEQVAELYRLCDVMVHAALEESFGLSIVEAMAAACPVLIHDAPHFEWLAGSRGPLVDMTKGGALAARLARVRAGDDPSAIEAAVAARAAQSVERFDWQHLRDDHVALYQRLSAEVRR
jgi:glycosyltransferase involved in cell wall biosynthesis